MADRLTERQINSQEYQLRTMAKMPIVIMSQTDR